MPRDLWKTIVVALAALLLVLVVLTFVAYNPWMLFGLAAILFAIAAIVRAINGAGDSASTSLRLRNSTTTRRDAGRSRPRRTRP